ncbi:MAG: lytic transglycosylase domain-containing protein [Xanthomonadaceae bacterium]|nr:lytic transglycosylase domain-containing protein [Xanthomonadaceae bacterium]
MKVSILFLITFVLSQESQGAYFSPNDSWMSTPSKGAANSINAKSIYSLKILDEKPTTTYSLDQVLSDPDALLPEEFRVTPALKEITKFWLAIYTKYDSKQTVVFDETHPEMIYEVLDFHELEKKSRNRMVYEIVREQRIKKTLAEYQSAFQSLKRKKYIKKKTAAEQKILSALSKLGHKHSLKELADNLKIQTGQRDALVDGLSQWEPFAGKIETIFKAVGVPAELARLSLVESSFNLKATSKVGAVGVWQFMESSGKHFLRISPDKGIDERRSPIKSAVAAAKMLKQNYRGLKSWPFAVIAYNSGMKKIIRNPKTFKNDHGLSEVIRLCGGPKGLGWAGKNYFPEFLAMLHAEKYRNQFFNFAEPKSLQGVAFITVNSKESLLQYAVKNGIDAAALMGLNPDIKSPYQKIPKGTLIAIPDKHDRFQLLLSTEFNKQRNHSG